MLLYLYTYIGRNYKAVDRLEIEKQKKLIELVKTILLLIPNNFALKSKCLIIRLWLTLSIAKNFCKYIVLLKVAPNFTTLWYSPKHCEKLI